MTLPTAKSITEKYLWGDAGKPNNLSDPNVVREIGVTTTIDISSLEFMADDGPGRFALGSRFSVVLKFFLADAPLLEAGRYSKFGMYDYFGLDSYSSRVLSFQHAAIDDGNDDYAERTYIYNSQTFEVQDGAVFVVEEDGSRYIENFATVVTGVRLRML